MWSRKVKYLHFWVFHNETKTLQQIRNNVMTTRNKWVWNRKRFALSNKETIVNKREDRNGNF